jgi:hypothetical protein
MRGQAAAIGKIGRDFVRRETNGPTQLDVRQTSFSEIEDGLEADAEVSRNLFRRPQGLRRVLDFLRKRRIPERAVIERRSVHRGNFRKRLN